MIDRFTFIPLAHRLGLRPKVDYHAYLQSSAWRRRARACYQRAGYRCQVCNSPRSLQAHHRTYERLGAERPADLTCLCDACHRLFSHNRSLTP